MTQLWIDVYHAIHFGWPLRKFPWVLYWKLYNHSIKLKKNKEKVFFLNSSYKNW